MGNRNINNNSHLPPRLSLFLVLYSLILIFGFPAHAAEIYNYALGRIPAGTFTNPVAAVDNSAASFAVSGNIDESPQFFTIDLGQEIYIGSVKLLWDAAALPRNYSLRVSNDKKNWFTEFSGLDASQGAPDPLSGTISQIVSTRRYTIPSRYLQIYIPIGASATAPQVKIAEIQILPAQDLSFSLLEVKPYAITNQNAIIMYKTSIGAVSGQVLYGRNPNNLNKMAANSESGVINSATLTGLEPGFNYFYKVKAWDAFGNKVESDVDSFSPPRANLALGKTVTGTFTNLPPNDNLVDKTKNVLSRVVDGITGYFKGMATSGSIRSGDQQVIIDLGASYPVDAVISYWRALAYPESFSVSLSEDKASWTEISKKINAGEGAFARSDAGDPMRVVNTPLNGARARYIQIFIAKNSPYFVKHINWDFVQLMEVQVISK
jgi:hypothetical protein